MHLDDLYTITELADHYQASTEAIRQWLILAKKHTLPDIDDKLGWFNFIIQNLGARMEDAKDTDAAKLGQLLSQMIGVGSLEELRAAVVNIEAAKVRLMANKLGDAMTDAGIPVSQRRAVLEVLSA